MWYISFAGGPQGVNNIWVYHDSGRPHARPDLLPTGKSDPPLREVRGFALAGRRLYVVNAYERDSQILLYEADEDGAYQFKQVWASQQTTPALVHPYDLTFDGEGNCYVSSQDSNVVMGLDATGSPLAVASYLRQHYPPPAAFLPGTVVASSIGSLPGLEPPPGSQPPPDVAAPQGLAVSFTGHAQKTVAHSVRGVLFHAGYLYVADEPADAVKVYDARTGELHGRIAGGKLCAPAQLLAAAGVLYIGSSESDRIMSYDLAQGPPAGTVTPRTFLHGGVKHVSGMAFDPDGHFYVAERKAKRIMRFAPDGGREEFIADLSDEPEFIRHVPRRG